MALNIGKKLVHLVAFSSFTLATIGIVLFLTPVLTPEVGANGKVKEGSWREIEQRKTKLEGWFKEKGGSPSPIQIAANRYFAMRSKIQILESQVVEAEGYYAKETQFLKTVATEKEPAKAITLKSGQPVRLSKKLVPLAFEEVKDIDGQSLENLKAQASKIQALDDEIRVKQSEFDKLSKENKHLVDLQADVKEKGADGKEVIVTKGYQTRVEEEKVKIKLFGTEFDAIEQAYINLSLERADLIKRRKELDTRLIELRNSGLATLP